MKLCQGEHFFFHLEELSNWGLWPSHFSQERRQTKNITSTCASFREGGCVIILGSFDNLCPKSSWRKKKKNRLRHDFASPEALNTRCSEGPSLQTTVANVINMLVRRLHNCIDRLFVTVMNTLGRHSSQCEAINLNYIICIGFWVYSIPKTW